MTVLARLRRDGQLDRGAILATELIRMVETVPSPVSTPYCARFVVEAAVFRSIKAAGRPARVRRVSSPPSSPLPQRA